MKTMKYFILGIALTLAFTACDNEDETPGNSISTEEAAEIVAASVAEGSMGASASIQASAAIAEETSEAQSGGKIADCGFTEESTLSLSGGVTITYDYSFDYSYELTCTAQNTPQMMSFMITYSGEFDSPRLTSTNTGSASWNLSGLELASTDYLLNGSYYRNGSFESKVRNRNATTSSVEFEMTDVTVDKSTYEIESGSATVSITGTVVNKGGFEFTGTVVFLGDGQAEVTINGVKYVFEVESGEIVDEN